VIEAQDNVPFEIKRVYYLYSVPDGATRGGHAHRRLRQVLVAVAGRLDVVLDDGHGRRTVRLDSPHRGLYVSTMVWRELIDFAAGTVCLVLASERYDEADYIRDYDQYLRLRSP
jgi:hypothetical protein